MTVIDSQRWSRPLDPTRLVLATDLDGTLLAGTHEARRRVRDLFAATEGMRPILVFVTGRGLETVMPLLSDPTIPTPDYIIADVGATVVDHELRPVEPIQHELTAHWPGSQAVLKALQGFPQLVRQSVPQERRCSFLASEDAVTPALQAAVAALDCELLFSAGRYLDVLPRGVGKGAALRRLAASAGFDPASVVVAGDTLNDLSMFEAGFRGVVVGGAEPALAERVRKNPRVHVATQEGCGGILEGLARHGVPLGEPRPQDTEAPVGASDLVMVYHRLPFDEIEVDGITLQRRPKSPNGIMPTLLNFFAGGRKGSWVAWSQQASRAPAGFQTHVAVDSARYPNLQAARIALTEEDVDLFYKKFST